MRSIVWLASYPKSGNTWLRVFLTNYLRDSAAPVSINALTGVSIASSRQTFEAVLGLDASDFAPSDAEALRADMFRGLAADGARHYVKVHDANVETSRGEPLLPPEATSRAIYIVRDPRDVVVSLAHHIGISADEAILRMRDPGHTFCPITSGIEVQLPQRLLTWSGHVESWTTELGFPVRIIRYEDMLDDPSTTFAATTRFLELDVDENKLTAAIRASAFDELRRQEDEYGFAEKPAVADRFFRFGRAGAWRTVLRPDQSDAIERDHTAVMQRFGYLT